MVRSRDFRTFILIAREGEGTRKKRFGPGSVALAFGAVAFRLGVNGEQIAHEGADPLGLAGKPGGELPDEPFGIPLGHVPLAFRALDPVHLGL